ncbi:MAG TPA: hypothetical protein VFE56_08845 [Candidatus Binataceae bacterium]|jgi:hypothetical protein|nr:hypothetical protein [Candidatus Binataceae bacterium]
MSTGRAAIMPLSGGMLTHFTRASHPDAALDNLVAILAAGTIRAATRMIRTKRPVVCFFDAPFEHLGRVLDPRNRRRYEPFGIAVSKRYAFRMGARPVIYLPWREAVALLPESELWRVVSIDINRQPAVDWTFEREWRLLGDLCFAARDTVVLVEDWRDADEIYERFDGHPPCAGVLPLKSLFPPQA